MLRYLDNDEDLLILENDLIRRELTFRHGCPVSSVLIRKASGYRWETSSDTPVWNLPDFDWEICETTWDEEKNTVTFEGNYLVRWIFEVAENAPAIRSQLFVKAYPKTEEEKAAQAAENSAETLSGIENTQNQKKIRTDITESAGHTGKHLKLRCVRFYDRTDGCNSLVREDTAFPYKTEEGFSGNLFFATDKGAGESCVILKESPVGNAHLNRNGSDLYASCRQFSVSGSGVDFSALSDKHFTACYGVTLALCRIGEEEATSRAIYADAYGEFIPFMMSNTWGDRSRDAAVCEEFLMNEIMCAERLGIDIVQIDDGWQKGISGNSAFTAEKKVWREGFYAGGGDFWEVNPERFPHGLGAVCDFAYDHHVALGLWFHPDSGNDFENWEKDAEVLLGFYRTYGIRYFKLDGFVVATKQAEYNLTRFCLRLIAESEGRIQFNMDITASSRLGYFCEKSIGTLFVENRYTDWGNYYPYTTARNLWQLSHFIPAPKFQFEVLNLRRNSEKYMLSGSETDPLAPANYDIDYCFASVMAANPLLWMEMQHLSREDTDKLRAIIAVYKTYRDDFVEIIPRGTCPDGYSVFGYEIRGKERTYYIGFREYAETDSVRLPVERILSTNDPELVCDGDRVTFSGSNKYFFAILRTPLNERYELGGTLA